MTLPPQYVMHFYGNLQYALDTIGFKEITFLHPDKLNDPFDPPFSFETDFNEDYDTLINHVQQHHAENLDDFRERIPQEKWQLFVKEICDHFNNRQKNGV